jgi:oxygen-independent coproporphyrinogen-3 oxidase
MAGIYLHIPFCRKACHYCNFHFSTSTQRKGEMIAAMVQEAELQQSYIQEAVDTIYFGGGTPSILTVQELSLLLDALHRLFRITADAEITLEANPDDIDVNKLQHWRQAGINRLSIGVQSFNDADLHWMNRSHTAAQSIRCIEQAQENGFSNISIDLIYGLPAQTDQEWVQHLNQAFALEVPHLSCYALTVEPATALAHQISKHPEWQTDPEKQAAHFHLLMQSAATAGFEHYEISNFAKPGFRSRHNSSYWQGKPYLGLGPSAHSYNGKSRQWNIANNALYIKSMEAGTVPFEMETLTETQRFNEYVMTTLRTIEGISLPYIRSQWGTDGVNGLIQTAEQYLISGKLKMEKDYLLLTKEGKFFADGIASDLFR